jgi:hypothetical protein
MKSVRSMMEVKVMIDIGFKEIKKADIPRSRQVATPDLDYPKLVNGFLDSTAEAYEVNVPEKMAAWTLRNNLYTYIRLSGLQDKVKVRVRENKRVFLERA